MLVHAELFQSDRLVGWMWLESLKHVLRKIDATNPGWIFKDQPRSSEKYQTQQIPRFFWIIMIRKPNIEFVRE
jgi:hypothetical protein